MKTTKKILLTIAAFLFIFGTGIFDTIPVYAYETSLQLGQVYTYTTDEMDDTDFSFETSTTKKIKVIIQSLNGKSFGVSGYCIFDEENDDYDDFWDLEENDDTTYYETTFTMKPGKCSISVTTWDDNSQFSICVQDVGTYAHKIKLSKKNLKMDVGETQTLKAKATVSGAMLGKITWKSSNTSVASVNSKGEVKAKGLGKTIISAQLKGGNTVKCTVYVNKDYIYLAKGKSKQIKLQNVSSNVSWKVKNKTIAKISKSGKVTAQKDGKTSLTYKKNGITYTVNVIVTDYNELKKQATVTIKPYLKDPDSLKIYNTSCTTYGGKPALFIDFGAKNSFGAYVRNYCWIFYDNQHNVNIVFL